MEIVETLLQLSIGKTIVRDQISVDGLELTAIHPDTQSLRLALKNIEDIDRWKYIRVIYGSGEILSISIGKQFYATFGKP